MEVIIKAKPKEIAALLREIETQQYRHTQGQSIYGSGSYKNLDSKNGTNENFCLTK